MGKKAKEHRKKVAKRNELIKQQIKKAQKFQKEALMQLIERERKAGKFDNNPLPGVDGPSIDLGQGPQI